MKLPKSKNIFILRDLRIGYTRISDFDWEKETYRIPFSFCFGIGWDINRYGVLSFMFHLLLWPRKRCCAGVSYNDSSHRVDLRLWFPILYTPLAGKRVWFPRT